MTRHADPDVMLFHPPGVYRAQSDTELLTAGRSSDAGPDGRAVLDPDLRWRRRPPRARRDATDGALAGLPTGDNGGPAGSGGSVRRRRRARPDPFGLRGRRALIKRSIRLDELVVVEARRA